MSELSELEASIEAQSTEALIALALPMPINHVYDDDGNVTFVTQRWPVKANCSRLTRPLFILPRSALWFAL